MAEAAAAPGKKIAIFGATGPPGLPAPGLAPQEGSVVTVLVRDAGQLRPQQRPARVVLGDVRDPATGSEAVRGQDAGIILLGTHVGTDPDPQPNPTPPNPPAPPALDPQPGPPTPKTPNPDLQPPKPQPLNPQPPKPQTRTSNPRNPNP